MATNRVTAPAHGVRSGQVPFLIVLEVNHEPA